MVRGHIGSQLEDGQKLEFGMGSPPELYPVPAEIDAMELLAIRYRRPPVEMLPGSKSNAGGRPEQFAVSRCGQDADPMPLSSPCVAFLR
jgi:hypothetical protein